MVAFDRALAVEASRHPELATRFFEAGPYYCRAKLAEMLVAARDRGEIAIDDPLQGAEDLVGLWLGMLHKELAMGRVASPSAADIERRVRHGIAVFLRAYAT
jgi:TetR/AcrR family transcriptional repressor of mexJK operon